MQPKPLDRVARASPAHALRETRPTPAAPHSCIADKTARIPEASQAAQVRGRRSDGLEGQMKLRRLATPTGSRLANGSPYSVPIDQPQKAA